MEVDCPFCPFKDYDHRYVIQHVECCHPEFGDSPFMVTTEDGKPLPVAENKIDFMDPSTAPSEEEYVECECGEVVMLPEFTSHIALHDMEETTADLAAPTILHATNSLDLNNGHFNLNTESDNGPYKGDDSSPRTVVRRDSRAGHHKTHHTVQDFMSVLLGSSSLHSRTRVTKTRRNVPRRLGVSILLMPISSSLIPMIESRARSTCS